MTVFTNKNGEFIIIFSFDRSVCKKVKKKHSYTLHFQYITLKFPEAHFWRGYQDLCTRKTEITDFMSHKCNFMRINFIHLNYKLSLTPFQKLTK